MNALEQQLRQTYCQVVYAHKAHHKEADECTSVMSNIKIAQIVLSAITTGGLITALLAGPDMKQMATIFAALFSTLLLVLNAYLKNVDPGRQAELHVATANKLRSIREDYLSILVDLDDNRIDERTAAERRDKLKIALDKIFEAAPISRPRSFIKARKALASSEEKLTFTEEEINRTLPERLRRTDGS